jgi:Cof subfamily protein (haloacid dehalogenase superfamily)
LIALDLDGTLLDSALQISDANMDALRRAMELGVAVALSTGRMFRSAKAFAMRIGTGMPIICYNGAMTRRPDGETMANMPLDIGVARGLLSMFRDRDMYVQSYIDDVLHVRSALEGEAASYMSVFGVEGRSVGDALYSPEAAPTKLLAVTSGLGQSHEIVREMSGIFGGRLYITVSNANFVEMMDPGANKGDRLEELARGMGFGMESVMAIGDGENDVEMISRAGVGIAMRNGLDRVLSAADDIAPTNDEDGVAWAVARYVLNAQPARGDWG